MNCDSSLTVFYGDNLNDYRRTSSQVCELDIIFNFEKAYFILDEFLMGGEIQETSKQIVNRSIEASDMLQEVRRTRSRTTHVICRHVTCVAWLSIIEGTVTFSESGFELIMSFSFLSFTVLRGAHRKVLKFLLKIFLVLTVTAVSSSFQFNCF